MEELENALDLAFANDDWVIAEEAVDGFEVGCAILGKEELTIGRVDEIELSTGFLTTMKNTRSRLPKFTCLHAFPRRRSSEFKRPRR